MGIAQPALGRQIQLLESELGVKLFRRTAKGMLLTEEGEYLRDVLGHPIKQIDTALRSVRSHASRIETALSFGLPTHLAALIGPRLFARLSAEVANLRLHIVEDHSSRLAADLKRGLIDIAILVGVTPDERVFNAPVLQEQLFLVGAPESQLARTGSVRIEDLHHFPLVLPGEPDTLKSRLEKALASSQAGLTLIGEVDSAQAASRIAGTGMCYTVLPRVCVREQIGQGTLVGVPLDPVIDQPVFYAIQPNWKVRRETYNEVERVIFEIWREIVESGEWPAHWCFDDSKLSANAGTA